MDYILRSLELGKGKFPKTNSEDCLQVELKLQKLRAPGTVPIPKAERTFREHRS